MPRIPWDLLAGSPFVDELKQEQQPENFTKPSIEEDRTVDFSASLSKVAKRMAFGAVAGSLTGAAFGFVDVLKDHKLLMSKRSLATTKIVRNAGLFGGFFSSYHGCRAALKICFLQSKEENILSAGVLSLSPLAVFSSLRPMIPYAVLLVGLDAFNDLYG